MLVLSRREGESIFVGNNVRVVVTRISGSRVKIGIEAPTSIRISRPVAPVADMSRDTTTDIQARRHRANA